MRIRPAGLGDAAGIARVRVDSWRSTYRGLVSDSYLVSLSYEEQTRNWQAIMASLGPQKFGVIAEDDTSQIVGFALGGFERSGSPIYTGELYAIYLLKQVQRQGLGRGLVAAIARELLNAGMASMLVWVLSSNKPARAFYEALGGRLEYQQEINIGGTLLVEVAYGWDDIRWIAKPPG